MDRWLILWNSLSATESNRFLRFVSSPYHNSDQRLIQITEHLLSASLEDRSRLVMHELLFPGEEYEYFRISNVLSYFANLIKEFLAFEYLRQNPDQFAGSRMKGLQEKNLIQPLQHEFRLIRKTLTKKVVDDEASLTLRQILADEEDTLILRQGERKFSEGLDTSVNILHEKYILEMIKRCCQWQNRQLMIPGQSSSSIIDDFILRYESKELSIPQNPLIHMYSYVLDIFLKQNINQAYQQLMDGLQEYGASFPLTDEQALYQYARNFCIRKSNAGDSEYLRALLEVYRRMIDRELIFFDDTLNPGDMKNIVSLGIILKEFDWTKWFLETHGHRIVEEHKKNALAYNQAHLEYAIGQYGRALNLLAQVELEDVFYALGARTILLKCYFENRDAESLYDHINAFTKWLSRNRHLADSQKQAHKRLLKVVKMIHKYRVVPMGPKAKLNLKSRIDTLMAHKGISQAGWLGQQWKDQSPLYDR